MLNIKEEKTMEVMGKKTALQNDQSAVKYITDYGGGG